MLAGVFNALSLPLSVAVSLFTLINLQYRLKKELREQNYAKGQIDGKLSQRLDNIDSGINDLREKTEQLTRMMIELSGQLARTDESVKSAHKRISDILKTE